MLSPVVLTSSSIIIPTVHATSTLVHPTRTAYPIPEPHSSQPPKRIHSALNAIRGYHSESFLGAGQSTAVLKYQKHQPRLQLPLRELSTSGLRENSPKTGSALSASIVHASRLLNVDAPSPQAAGGHCCERKRSKQKNDPVPQPFPQCRLFKSKKHRSCRHMRMRMARLGWKIDCFMFTPDGQLRKGNAVY